ncbi:MAG: aspartate kinase [Bacteroidetes bacterium]|nr:aspartate kinase [Bacteroidota bacterium]
MKVFKFGGASINSIERIKNVGDIISKHSNEKLLVVISAMGKTTNALEKVVEAFFEGRKEDALQLFEQVKESHLNVLKYLTVVNWKAAQDQLRDFFTEVEWLLQDKPVRSFDYYYDQVVCVGELMSTAMISHYFTEEKIKHKWIDVRDIIRTDSNFRDAAIDWRYTEQKVKEEIEPLFASYDIVLTQGFIGSTDENESTTLGREGSDYSAAIFANLLTADSLTIWKDVEAVMSADPKAYKNAAIIPALSFTEVIEMAYYGAQVIHPKTIKPLQNKNIPLYVKSFIDPSLPGTTISRQPTKNLPPIIVDKEKQVLIQFRSKDFSFVEDKPIHQLHELFNKIKIKPNLSQNTAISLLCCFDDKAEKIEKLAEEAAQLFDVSLEKNLRLLTIRHYDEDTIRTLTTGKVIVLEQKTGETVQMVMR